MSCWPAELTFSVSTSEILAQLFTLNIMTYDYELHIVLVVVVVAWFI